MPQVLVEQVRLENPNIFSLQQKLFRKIRSLQPRAREEADVPGRARDPGQEVHEDVQVSLHPERGQPVPGRQSRGRQEGGEGGIQVSREEPQ